jgi:hypothetical protein
MKIPPRLIILAYFVVLSFVFVSSAPAAPTARIECKSLPSKILGHPVNYCVVLPPSYDGRQSAEVFRSLFSSWAG